MSCDSGLRLVCFDLGGVVVRICRTWAEGCAAAGVEFRGGTQSPVGVEPALRELSDAHQRGRINLRTYARRFSELVGGLYRPEEVMRVHDAWILGEYEGVSELVGRIHEAGLETAVLSNTSREHWQTMPKYPSLRLLHNRHGSHELGLRKPERAIFHALERHTGCSGSEIAFFDDLEENVASARELGWRAHQIDHLGSPPEQIAAALEGWNVPGFGH